MNKFLFRISFTFLLFSLATSKSFSQKLNTLIPDAGIVQHGGSIGYFSVGAGYEIFKNKKGYLDLSYGYVPASKGGKLHALTVKIAYKPLELKLNDWAKLYPFNPGFFLSYSFQEDLAFKFHSNEYPRGYYYWSPALRPHLSIANEVELSMPKNWDNKGIHKIGLYTEFNTNDFYIVNYFQNASSLSLADVFQLGIGIRLKF